MELGFRHQWLSVAGILCVLHVIVRFVGSGCCRTANLQCKIVTGILVTCVLRVIVRFVGSGCCRTADLQLKAVDFFSWVLRPRIGTSSLPLAEF